MQILLRPEDLAIVAPGAGRVDGHIESCTFFGAYHELRIVTPVGTLKVLQPVAIAPGTAVGIDWSDVAGIAYAAGDPAPSGRGM